MFLQEEKTSQKMAIWAEEKLVINCFNNNQLSDPSVNQILSICTLIGHLNEGRHLWRLEASCSSELFLHDWNRLIRLVLCIRHNTNIEHQKVHLSWQIQQRLFNNWAIILLNILEFGKAESGNVLIRPKDQQDVTPIFNSGTRSNGLTISKKTSKSETWKIFIPN